MDKTPTPVTNVTPTAPVTTPPAKPHRTGLVVLLIVLLAIAGGTAGYMVARFAGMSTQPATTTTTVVTQTKVPEKPKHIALLEELSKQISAGDVQKNGRAPAVQPDGLGYAVQPVATAPALKLNKSAADAKVTLASITSFFKAKNYNEKDIASNVDSSLALTDYTTPDVKCTLGSNYMGINDTTNPVAITVGCLDQPGYDALATAAKPYYAAYSQSADAKKSTVVPLYLDNPKVTASKTPDYQLATYSMGTFGGFTGYAGLYYQTPDKTWHFLTGAQNSPACSTYTTADQKKAYLGVDCYDTKAGKAAVVTL